MQTKDLMAFMGENLTDFPGESTPVSLNFTSYGAFARPRNPLQSCGNRTTIAPQIKLRRGYQSSRYKHDCHDIFYRSNRVCGDQSRQSRTPGRMAAGCANLHSPGVHWLLCRHVAGSHVIRSNRARRLHFPNRIPWLPGCNTNRAGHENAGR